MPTPPRVFLSYSHDSDAHRDRMSKRTTLADALHQQCERGDARAAFAEAERMPAQRQPQCPLLYSLRGFRYCDLLLAGAERAAWAAAGGLGKGNAQDEADQVAACDEVAERARQTLKIAEDQLGLLDIALDRLTLARGALYQDRLQGHPPGPEAREHAERALDRLRAAGTQDHIPRGLITRAWLCHCLNEPDAARAALVEARRLIGAATGTAGASPATSKKPSPNHGVMRRGRRGAGGPLRLYDERPDFHERRHLSGQQRHHHGLPEVVEGGKAQRILPTHRGGILPPHASS